MLLHQDDGLLINSSALAKIQSGFPTSTSLGNPLPKVAGEDKTAPGQNVLTCFPPADSKQTASQLTCKHSLCPAPTPASSAQHSTCSAWGFPEAALKHELVWQHHSHLWKEFKISRPISCMSWSLGIISFGSIPADFVLRSSLWTLATPWILAPIFCVSSFATKLQRHLTLVSSTRCPEKFLWASAVLGAEEVGEGIDEKLISHNPCNEKAHCQRQLTER